MQTRTPVSRSRRVLDSRLRFMTSPPEAVFDALFVADTVTGPDGTVIPGLPIDRVLQLLRRSS
jgi:hypothetical protein